MPSQTLSENAAEGPQAAAGPSRLISAHRVQGTPAFARDGEKFGHIEDVMLDKQSGRVAYAILAYGGFLGAGERFHPLPWSVLSYHTDKDGYVVDLSKEALEQGPTLGRDYVEENDAVWTKAVHKHYGLPGPFI